MPPGGERFRKFCKRCKAFKPKRAHHCSICKRCIVKMDHHWCVLSTHSCCRVMLSASISRVFVFRANSPLSLPSLLLSLLSSQPMGQQLRRYRKPQAVPPVFAMGQRGVCLRPGSHNLQTLVLQARPSRIPSGLWLIHSKPHVSLPHRRSQSVWAVYSVHDGRPVKRLDYRDNQD